MKLTSSATYHFGERFSLGAGIPVYFNRSTSTNGLTTSDGIGDVLRDTRRIMERVRGELRDFAHWLGANR